MLLIALFGIFLSFSFLGWGKIFAALFGKNAAREDFSETGYFFMGLSFVGVLCSGLWCFMPVNQWVGLIFMFLGSGFLLTRLPFRLDISFRNPWFLMATLVFSLAFLVKAASPSNYYDCGLYYLQTMKWIGQFPVVPGLGNLHIRFGNASAWHILLASFDWKPWLGLHFDDLGELILLWFVIFHGWNAFKMHGFERYISLGLVAISIFLCYPLLSSPSPDLACGVLGMQTLWQFRKFLRAWNPRQPNQLNTRGLALFIQSLFLVQIKLSAMPFLIISILILFLIAREKWIKMVSILGAFGALVGLSTLYRSYMLTGYAFFPVWKGPFSADWRVSDLAVSEYLNGVRGFARHILSPAELASSLDYNQIGKWPFLTWFPIWASERTFTDWAVMILAVLGWLLLVRFASGHVRRSFRSHWPLIFFTWLLGMMLLFWFSNAPDIRFGIAVLGLGFSFTFASVTEGIRNLFSQWNSRLYAEICVVSFSILTLFFFRDKRAWTEQIIYPPSYPNYQIQGMKTEERFQYFIPQTSLENPFSDQCWDAPLPCAPAPIPGLKPRGKSLGDGFIIQN
jgi:hypothetical protein